MSDQRISDFEVVDCKFKCSLWKKGEWVNSSNSKLTKDVSTGHVYIACVLDYHVALGERRVSVKVMKTNQKPAMASINLQLSEMNCHIRNVHDWKKECEFTKLPFKSHCQTCLGGGTCSISGRTEGSHEYSIEIKCKIIWYGFVEDSYSPTSSKFFIPYSENMKFFDMKIKVGEIFYQAHKIIVGSRSPVLEKALTVKMKESEENSIDLTDLGADVVEELLLFLYENRINKAENDENLQLKLLRAGEMYDVPNLKNWCGMLLSNKLTEDNVLMMLENGHVYNSSILQTRAIAYIVENRNKFLPQKEFKELTQRQPGLFLEFCFMMNFFLNS